MRSGALRHRIVIESPGTQQDAAGQPYGWTPFVETWASISPLSGRQLMAARAVQNETTHQICLRYVSGITPAMRINLRGRFFDIVSVRNVDERNRELEIEAKEGLSDG